MNRFGRVGPLVSSTVALGVVVAGLSVAAAPVVGAAAVTTAATQSSNSSPGTYRPLMPARLLDTRIGDGAPKSAVAARATVALQVTGRGGVPSSGVSAVVINLTATSEAMKGYLTAYPAGRSRPIASNVNFVAQTSVANLSAVPVGTNGQIDIYNGSDGNTAIVADVSGYYLSGAATAAGAFVPLGPVRVLDTRTGAHPKPVAAHGTQVVRVTGVDGVPDSGVGSITVNVTVNQPTAGGYITAYEGGMHLPTVSCLNFVTGETRANRVTVPVGSAGTIDFYLGSSGSAQLIVDIQGYTLAGKATVAGGFVPVIATRLLDTRHGAPAGQGFLTVVPDGPVPSHAEAMVINVTATNVTKSGYLSAGPFDLPAPPTSSINYQPGRSTAGELVVPMDSNEIEIFTHSTATEDVVVDVQGYFVAPSLSWTETLPAVDPHHGTLLTVACATSTWCVGADSIGDVLVDDAGVWGTPVNVDTHPLATVQCASTSRCVGIDQVGDAVIYDGTSWSAPAPNGLGFYDTPPTLSCPTVSTCVLGGFGQVSVLSGTTWTATTLTASQQEAVSCASATSCTAVSTAGDVSTYNGSSWTTPVIIDAKPLTQVSCPSTGDCVATDSAGSTLVEQSGVWGTAQPDGAGNVVGFLSLSCYSMTDCLGLSTGPRSLYTFDGSSWTAAPGGVLVTTHVSCPGPSFCMSVNDGSDQVWNGSSWSATQLVEGNNTMSAFSCASASSCQLGDHEGRLITFDGLYWPSSTELPARGANFSPVEQISCAADGSCLALLPFGEFVTYLHGSWSAPTDAPTTSPASLSCASATFCLLDSGLSSWTYDGQGWSAAGSIPITTGKPSAPSCASPTYCVVLDGEGHSFQFDGTSWSSARTMDSYQQSTSTVACSPDQTCAAVVGLGPGSFVWTTRIDMLANGVWSPGQTLDGLVDASCASASFCVAMNEYSQTYIYDGATWIGPDPSPVTSAGSPFAGALDCTSDSFCMAAAPELDTVLTGRAS